VNPLSTSNASCRGCKGPHGGEGGGQLDGHVLCLAYSFLAADLHLIRVFTQASQLKLGATSGCFMGRASPSLVAPISHWLVS
jgi:hypothetical protein